MSSNTYEKDLVVYIGRMQIFHNGHLETLKHALTYANKVLILLGSSNLATNIRNPFGASQREEMIRCAMKYENIPQERVIFHYIKDYPYNDNLWLNEVQAAVSASAFTIHGMREIDVDKEPEVGIIGFKRDHTSFYLDLFPQWEGIGMEEVGKINATAIRSALFETGTDEEFQDVLIQFEEQLPKGTAEWLLNYARSRPQHINHLREEHAFIKNYKKQFEDLAYPPVFLTGDAVVVQSGHILLVARGAMPGKGQWALPGGFINTDERIFEGVVRELVEETRLKVPEKKLRRCVMKKDVFDAPERSLRGRTVTHAYFFELDAVPEGLPKVKGQSGEVAAIRWVPFAEVKKLETQMFEDHYAIITNLVGNF